MDDMLTYLDNALQDVQLLQVNEKPIVSSYNIEAELCTLIINTRTQLGLTQKQLAKRSGVSQANISKIENGTYRPSIATLKKIADGFGKRLLIDFIDYEEAF